MLTQIAVILITAILSAVFTAGAVYALYRRRLRQELDAQLAEALDELDRRLQTAVADLGTTVEERVRQGVVRGVAAIPSSDVLADTTRTVAKTGVEIAGGALEALLGRRRKTD